MWYVYQFAWQHTMIYHTSHWNLEKKAKKDSPAYKSFKLKIETKAKKNSLSIAHALIG